MRVSVFASVLLVQSLCLCFTELVRHRHKMLPMTKKYTFICEIHDHGSGGQDSFQEVVLSWVRQDGQAWLRAGVMVIHQLEGRGMQNAIETGRSWFSSLSSTRDSVVIQQPLILECLLPLKVYSSLIGRLFFLGACKIMSCLTVNGVFDSIKYMSWW